MSTVDTMLACSSMAAGSFGDVGSSSFANGTRLNGAAPPWVTRKK